MVSHKTTKSVGNLGKLIPIPSMSRWPLRKLVFIPVLMIALIQLPAAQPNSQDTVVEVASGKIDITWPDEPLQLTHNDLLHWIKTAANTVSQFYGRFPVPHLTLRIRSDGRSGIHHGVTYATNGGLILITVGRTTTVSDLDSDWRMTHEIIHLAFPNMADEHRWIEEGISTYVEPVARAQAGQLPPEAVWKEFARDMPQGQPDSGDQGLDNTHTWGRTYWGGALFCLTADVQIREKTHNRKGLRDALRAINNKGNVADDWEIEEAFATGDKATGTTVLRDLYRQMRDKPSAVDLNSLWKKLGVEFKDGKVTFDDKAPEAAIRHAITAPVAHAKL
jgi:hypothetical protein